MSGFMSRLDPRRVPWGAAGHALRARVLRTKPVESMLEGTGAAATQGARLAKVLTTLDLISLGVGSCVGTGMYVVSGLVAKEMAGPGVIVSFIIAAVASILSGGFLGDVPRPASSPFLSLLSTTRYKEVAASPSSQNHFPQVSCSSWDVLSFLAQISDQTLY